MLNINTDFIAGNALKSKFSYDEGLSGVAAVNVGDVEYEVGSSVEVKNYSALIGISKDTEAFNFMPFVDVGSATSKTKGMGDSDSESKYKHISVGVLGRIGGSSGLYGDASIRVGRNKTEFEGRVEDQFVEFDSNANYYAGHIGLGYMVPFSDRVKMDLYAKYYLSHIDAQDVDLVNKATGEVQPWKIDAVNSQVSKVGAAFKFDLSDTLRLTAGAAWQRIWSGEAKAILDYSNYGMVGEAVTPDLKGDSVVIDLGMNLRATEHLDIGLEATGMFGDSQGGAVKGSFIYKF